MNMLTVAIAAFALANSGQAQENPLKVLFPRLTGTNGYEEYFQVLETVRRDNLIEALFKIPKENLTLTSVRKGLSGFSPMMAQLRLGDSKPLDPKTISFENFEKIVPYFARMKRLGEMGSLNLWAQCALGNPDRGVQDLITILNVSRKCLRSTLIAGLVQIAIDARAISMLGKNLYALPLNSLDRIASHAGEMVANTEEICGYFAGEQWYLESVSGNQKGEDNDWEAFFSDTEDPDHNAFRKLSEPEKKELAREIVRLGALRLETIKASIAGPESGWIDQEIFGKESLAERLYEQVSPEFSQSLVGMARWRTQWRIVRLATAVLKFRWETGELPATLKDCASDDWIADPLTQQRFNYRRNEQMFELYSDGALGTGRISFTYTRPPSNSPAEP